ncbi:MAG: redox-regulated ATPase YchF [candidate division Zixibacteria bacterium]|nr:redox-regulated ATPase YchF [candidate division Zixibacteria bacterium]
MPIKLQFGIIGAGQSGKTTIFNALCSANASVGDYSSAKAPNIAMVKVPEPRVDRMAEIYSSATKVFGEIEFVDIAGMASKGSASREEIADKLKDIAYIHAIRMAQALLVVVRCFEDENVPHPRGSINPVRDIVDIESELMLIDLVQIEKRIEKLEHLLKVKHSEENKRELTLLLKMREQLESEKPLREMEFTKDDSYVLTSFRFLSHKPVLYLLNLGENQIDRAADLEGKYLPVMGKNKAVTSICGKIEMEIAVLDEADRDEFLQDMGLEKPASERVIRQAFDLLGFITFLTAAENESRAWPIPDGYSAFDAAGEIHTDIQRGFIKAETIQFSDFDSIGEWNAVKKAGKLRLEGKDYLVKDGDVILFRFNV